MVAAEGGGSRKPLQRERLESVLNAETASLSGTACGDHCKQRDSTGSRKARAELKEKI